MATSSYFFSVEKRLCCEVLVRVASVDELFVRGKG